MFINRLHKIRSHQFGSVTQVQLLRSLRCIRATDRGRLSPSPAGCPSGLFVPGAVDAQDHPFHKHGGGADLRVRVQQGQ